MTVISLKVASATRRLIEPMKRLSRRTPPIALIAALAAVMLLAGTGVFHLSKHWGLQGMQAEANHRLDLFAAATDSMVNHYAHVPRLVELNPDVLALLRRPGDRKLVDKANGYLQQLNERIAGMAIYVMDARGLVLASSNWQRSDSFVGDDYEFRPYFQTAIQGREGHYYAVGTSRGEPGYYVSQPIREHKTIVGVAVIKIGLAPLEHSQVALGTPVLIADENGVVILTSVLGWKFKALAPLGPDRLAEVARSRRYNQMPIGDFPLPVAAALKSDAPFVVSIPEKLLAQAGDNYRPGNFIVHARTMPGTQWRLLIFSDLKTVRNQAMSQAALAVMAAGFVIVVLLARLQQQRYIRQKLESRALLEKANAELEQNVAERTADLVAVNERLRGEIAERNRAEQTLRSAQDELVQAAKLAVLGRMATGITHELAQPLSALRTLAGNAIEFMRRGDHATAQGNLDIIGGLVDQMGSIIVPLKTFARKSPAFPQAVDVAHVVGSALFLLDQRLRKANVTVENHCTPGSTIAWCDQNRLQQVLINLIGNAIDAMTDPGANCAIHRLAIDADKSPDGRIVVRVADSGPGLAKDVLEHLFEPFFTTKPMGEGLGIGLAISQDIVRDFGGALSAANGKTGGAVFTIDLPAELEVRAT